VADRSLYLLPTDVTGRQRSAMYDGASRPSMQRVVRQQTQLDLDALRDGKPVEAVSQHVLNVVVLLGADD